MILLCEECGVTHSTYLEATKRVRELAQKFLQETDDEMVNYHLVARRIFIALDGE
jgi:hypothetical protein